MPMHNYYTSINVADCIRAHAGAKDILSSLPNRNRKLRMKWTAMRASEVNATNSPGVHREDCTLNGIKLDRERRLWREIKGVEAPEEVLLS